jgi:hypothetical protein
VPSSVSDVFAVADLRPLRAVPWGLPVNLQSPGVYVVSLIGQDDASTGALAECPISMALTESLLRVRPELRVDGLRPSAEELAARLSALWLPDEVILYIGQTSNQVAKRVAQYYRTALGARSPHAGGWPLKLLSILNQLYVHCAPAEDFRGAEATMLTHFVGHASDDGRRDLRDPAHPLPFANLEGAGRRKLHGIIGARAPG